MNGRADPLPLVTDHKYDPVEASPSTCDPYAKPLPTHFPDCMVSVFRCRNALSPEIDKDVPFTAGPPSNRAFAGCRARNVHTQRSRDVNARRTSCHDVPPTSLARRRRMPSARASTRAPFNKPSIVREGSCWAAKAAGPLTLARTLAASPRPSYSSRHPSRPRPTSTQPPPSVVMSQ